MSFMYLQYQLQNIVKALEKIYLKWHRKIDIKIKELYFIINV